MNKREEARHLMLEALMNAPPTSLFNDPIEYIFADHFRQRTLCSVLDQIAEAETIDVELVEAALGFLQSEFGPHVLDEEEDLFPLLRRRAETEDDINQVLGQLSEEHASDEADGNQIIALLQRLLGSGDLSVIDSEAIGLLGRFAANERHHLIVENAIVLPLARARLSETDKQKLGTRMAARRGLAPPQVAND